MTPDPDPVYDDPERGTDERVADLLGRMTETEKVGQLVGMYVGSFDYKGDNIERHDIADIEAAIREVAIGSVTPFGTGVSSYNNTAVAGRIANRLQRVAITKTRLGIPLLVPVDAVHGHANIDGSTVFPHNLGMAATWNPELVQRAARVTAREMAATGANQNYAPTADVARDPRWGRTYETYGEAPHLVGELVAAEIAGLQGEDLRDPQSVAATVKHFPASSAPARGEDTAPVDVSPETLRRVFLPPFEAAFEADVAAVMPTYNAVGNEPAHASRRYLTDLLREDLGFTGITCSDWVGVLMLVEHHRTASSFAEAVEQATDAGLDIASVGGPEHAASLRRLVETGALSGDALDRRVRRVLELKFDLGLFEDPYIAPERTSEALGTDAHREVALETARQSITLLENRNGTLPLESSNDLVITGPNADSLDDLVGGWTVLGLDNTRGPTIREAMANAVDAAASVTHVPGIADGNLDHADRVVGAAKEADAAVVVGGESWYIHEFGPASVAGPATEFPKRNQLRLPGAQRRLIESIAETGTPTVLVLVAGRPLVLTDIVEHVDAIVMAYLPGIEGGRAITDVLLGEQNPSGRLPISFPRAIGDLPVRHDWLPHPNPIGSDEHLPSYDPLYAFGHGFGYTTFAYEELSCSGTRLAPDRDLTVAVTVENTGDRTGTEVVQLYVENLASSVVTPVRELKRFRKLELAPGEVGTVEFTLEYDDVAVSLHDGTDVVQSGEVVLHVEEFSRTIMAE